MPKQKYQKKLEHYTKVYGCSFRTIQRYSQLGYPLDDEAATRARISTQKFQPTGTPATGGEIGETPDAPQIARNARRTARTPETAAHGLAAAIDRLQAAEAEAHADYLKAVDGGKDILTGAKLKAWLSLSEQLRKVEQSTPDIQKQNNNSVSLSELSTTLGGLFARLRQDLDTLPRQVASKLVGKDAIGIEQELKKEVEQIIEALYVCKYLEGVAGE